MGSGSKIKPSRKYTISEAAGENLDAVALRRASVGTKGSGNRSLLRYGKRTYDGNAEKSESSRLLGMRNAALRGKKRGGR